MFKKLKQFKDLKNVYQELSKQNVEATGAKGKVKLTINGAFQVSSVEIDPELLSPDQKKKLEDGVKDAVQDGIKQVFKALNDNKDKFAGLSGMDGMMQ